MKIIVQYTTALILTVITVAQVNAQQYFDNFYSSANAELQHIQGDKKMTYVLKGATVVFPNGSNQLVVTVNIPYGDIGKCAGAYTDLSQQGYLFKLAFTVNRNEIQNTLTSSKIFIAHGLLTLNNITRQAEVEYVPVLAGTEEDGNFNIKINTRFEAADFNLPDTSGYAPFLLTIGNARVNRV